MNEIGQSIAEALRKRAVSSALGTYLFFWCVFHWEGIYTTIFTDQQIILEKFDLLKNEYVREYFFSWAGLPTFVSFVLPILLTFVFIWLLPKYVLKHAYRQEQRHKVDRRRIRYEEEELLEMARKDLAVSQKKAVEAEIDASDKLKEASRSNPEIQWQRDFAEFINIGNGIPTLNALKITIYKDNGHLTDYLSIGNDWLAVSGMNSEYLALADTNDLIKIFKEDQTIELSKKGKYFISKLGAAYQPVE